MTATAEITLPEQLLFERRLQAQGAVYRTMCRILTKEKIELKFVNYEKDRTPPWKRIPSPAWTDGINIFINTQYVDVSDLNVIERLHGLVFHETAHILFSPRINSKIVKWVCNNGYQRMFNALEDQRIERFLIKRYPSTSPWITTMLLRWILKLSSPELVYLLIAGRKHVPADVRRLARTQFTNQDVVDDIDRIVNEYVGLVFPTGYGRAQELIVELHDLFLKCKISEPRSSCGDQGTKTIHEGSPVSNNDQKTWRDSENSDDLEDDDNDSSDADDSDDDDEFDDDYQGTNDIDYGSSSDEDADEDDEFDDENGNEFDSGSDTCDCCGASLNNDTSL